MNDRELGWYPNRLGGAALPANTKTYAEVSRVQFDTVPGAEATHYMMFDKQSIQHAAIAGLAGNHLYIDERAKMIKSHTRVIANDLQFPPNANYLVSPLGISLR